MRISDWSSDVCSSDLPDGLLGETRDIGISLALIPRDTPGLDIGRRHFPLNVPFQNGPVRGKDVFVPLSALIGGPDMAGQGRSEEHTSELQSLMRISYAVFCLKKKTRQRTHTKQDIMARCDK